MNYVDLLTDTKLLELSRILNQTSKQVEQLVQKKRYKLDGFESVDAQNETYWHSRFHPECLYSFQFEKIRIEVNVVRAKKMSDFLYQVVGFGIKPDLSLDSGANRFVLAESSDMFVISRLFRKYVYEYLRTYALQFFDFTE